MTKLTLDNDDAVFFYEQDFYVLSNFSAFNVYWKAISFDTLEHAYHWEKFAHDMRDGELRNIRHVISDVVRSAHDAFQYAQEHKSFYDPKWMDRRVNVMRELLICKVQQHSYVRKKLLATGDRLLVENSWRDSFWGWGEDRLGENKLGNLWAEVRDMARKGQI